MNAAKRQRRCRSLRRFGLRYYLATRDDHTGHDYRLQAVRRAAAIVGPLDYLDILEVITGWSDAEEELGR